MDSTLALLALRARVLAVPGLPAGRAWDNVKFDPTSGQQYILERFIPATARKVTFPADGGQDEETGLYQIQLFGITGTGTRSIRELADDIKARFALGQGLGTLADGTSLRVNTNPGPQAGAITPIDGGWSFVTINIPWIARSTGVLVP